MRLGQRDNKEDMAFVNGLPSIYADTSPHAATRAVYVVDIGR